MIDSIDRQDWAGLKILELGNQVVHVNDDYPYHRNIWAKDFFEQMGVHHYSIDLNGRYGAHVLDLGKPIEDKFWWNRFDVVTNFGTAEHVEGQYDCWRNIHNFAKLGGIFIHVLPEVWPDSHCPYFYTREFLSRLFTANQYEHVKYFRVDSHTNTPEKEKIVTHRVACRKTSKEFRPDRETFEPWIVRNPDYEQNGNM